ncbi:site-specific integrase [Bacteroides mediterraneensis]|uniref:site-specific integrase n=1 Tax=Bacteroides mediterraneensis TaxID=1841856 RepID=UPI0009346ABB|nr:site-specific integrase [Bacteroides mediterraneensis]
MRHSFSIYFYLKRRKLQKDSKSTIMLRIIVNNKATDVSLKTSILQEHWDKQNKRVSTMNPEAHDINAYLDKVSSTLLHYYRQAQLEGKQLTASMLKQRFMATGSNPPSLLEIFDKQVKDADRLAHAGQISMSHSNRHKLVYRRLEEFCKKMGRQDMPLEQFNRQMIHELELFFRTDCRLSINTTAKMMSMVRKGILWAYRCGIILTNPFSTYRIKKEESQKQYLNRQEIIRIMNKRLDIPRLVSIRDIFIFSCFTGIAYSDICRLRKDQIISDSGKSMYIHLYRTKTNHPAFIPLLPQAKKIASFYIRKGESEYLFPTISNQKSNAYLKELADICHIRKRVTFHVARHTFAVTVCLENGLPIETLSKMLGHTNLRVTQAYARITYRKVTEDMKVLKNKLKDWKPESGPMKSDDI